MSNDGPYYHKKVYINSMENWGTTARKIDREYTFALTYWDISIVHFLKAAE